MDVSKLYEKAEDSLKRKNYDFTIEILKNQILQINPDEVKARKMLRAAEIEKIKNSQPASQNQLLLTSLLCRVKIFIFKCFKKWDTIIQEGENFLVFDPRNVKVLYGIGEASINAGYTDTAIYLLESIIGIDSQHFNSLKLLGYLYKQKGDLEKAINYYQKANKVDPKDHEASREVKALAASRTATDYGKAKSSRELIKDKDQTKDLEVDHMVLRTDEDFQRAIAKWKKQLDANPKDTKALRELGTVYQKHEEYDKAVECFKKYVEIDATSFDIKCRIGECRIATYDIKIRELKAKEGSDPSIKKQVTNLEKEKLKVEIEEYTDQVKNQPTNYDLRYKLGTALFMNGDHQEAISHFQQAIKDPRRKSDSYNYMGMSFASQNKMDLASKQFEKALEGIPAKSEKYKRIMYNLGDAQEKSGEKDKAIETFTKIYELDINYKDVAQRLDNLRT